MTTTLGRFQSVTHALSRLLEAGTYLASADGAEERAIAAEVHASAEKARKLRDTVIAALDTNGMLMGLTPFERARSTLVALPTPERLRLVADLVEACLPGSDGEQLAHRIRGLECTACQQT
jgi:hypothetical protein